MSITSCIASIMLKSSAQLITIILPNTFFKWTNRLLPCLRLQRLNTKIASHFIWSSLTYLSCSTVKASRETFITIGVTSSCTCTPQTSALLSYQLSFCEASMVVPRIVCAAIICFFLRLDCRQARIPQPPTEGTDNYSYLLAVTSPCNADLFSQAVGACLADNFEFLEFVRDP